jgi:hypothetical protein
MVKSAGDKTLRIDKRVLVVGKIKNLHLAKLLLYEKICTCQSADAYP